MTSESSPSLSHIYLIALAYNLVIIPFSKVFSSNLGSVDPLFSPSGCFLILLWGVAYASVCKVYRQVPILSAVFAVEKLFYGLRWIVWMNDNYGALMDITRDDALTGLFFSIYGIGDLAFAVFFFYSAACYWDGIKMDEKRTN